MFTFRKPLQAATILFVVSCVDDPVIVSDVPIETVDDIVALAQQKDDVTEDPFRARLEIEFSVTGGLAPNTPITMWLRGTASEDITGGQVEMALPTFAAMKLAGPGKRPQYVKGQKAPVVARWQLPAMAAGKQWSQSMAIASIGEKGYCQITAAVTAYGPFESPYVFDETFHEAWMYVVDSGGLLTPVFDETIFPDSIVPQAGTFEAWVASTAGDMATAQASAGSGTIRIQFLHQDRHGNQNPMTGATVKAEYVERGQVVTTVTRTVPSSGYITYNCPGADQHISGSVKNTTTSRVKGGHHLAYFTARPNQCNSGRTVGGNRHHFIPWQHLDKDAIPRITSRFGGYSRRAVKFTYNSRKKGASYDAGDDEITFGDLFAQLSVAGHEYTHALHNKALGGTWYVYPFNCRNHKVDKPSGYKCALKEGLADYGGYVAVNGTGSYWESKHYPPPAGKGAGEIEGNVAALFYDLQDAYKSSESDDLTSYPGSYIFMAFKTCRTPSAKRDDTADFVWCLERAVDEDVHDDHFPGLSAPSGVRESATEPADWDRDDIRSTWLRNVG